MESESGTEVGPPVYQVYRVLDDSTLVMHEFRDSALTVLADSARFQLRNGTVTWVRADRTMPLIGIAARSATFFPEGASRGGFTLNIQGVCEAPLAPATADCVLAGKPYEIKFTEYWHMARLLFGHEVAGTKLFVGRPLQHQWLSSIPPRITPSPYSGSE